MIQKYIDRFIAAKPILLESFRVSPPDDYKDLVRRVVSAVSEGELDPERIHEINDGHYQGLLIFVIGATGYTPRQYWWLDIDYGSCTTCDALEAAKPHYGVSPEDAAERLILLALHVVEAIKPLT